MSSSTARRAVPPRTRSAAASSNAEVVSARQTSTSSTAVPVATRATRAATTSSTKIESTDPMVKQSSSTTTTTTTTASKAAISKPGLRTIGTRKRPALGDLTNARRRERERLAALEREGKSAAGKIQAGGSKAAASSSKVGGATSSTVPTRGVTGIRRPGAEVNGTARRGTTTITNTTTNTRIGSTNRRALASTNTNSRIPAGGRGRAGKGGHDGRVLEEDEDEDGDGYEVDTRETKRIKTGGNYADKPLQEEEEEELVQVEQGPAKDEGWIDLDAEDIDDPLMVAEYVNDIFEYMKALELSTMPSGEYMERQPDITWNQRGVLVDWMIEIHTSFRLLPETLFLSLNIVDRFLSQRTISLSKLQLVGITAMFIAAKYEEVICPSVQNFLHVAKGNYNEEEALRSERYILKVIKFNLSYPNPMNFLRRISKADNYDIQTRTVAKYFMEISLVDFRLLEHPPSLVAAGAVWMAREVLERGEWSPTLVHYSSYSETELLATAEIMLDYVLRPIAHEQFHKKYRAKKFMKASSYVVEWAKGAFPEAAEAAAQEEEQDFNTLLVDLYERQGLYRPGFDGTSRASTVERESLLLETGDFEGSENDEGVESEDGDEDEDQEQDEEEVEEEEEETYREETEDDQDDDGQEEIEEPTRPSRRGGRR